MLYRTKNFTYDLLKSQAFWREALGKSGIYQPESLAAALKGVQKWNLAIDVGAHFGMNSMAYSRLFKSVVSFEPHPGLYRQALKHFRLNKISNVELHNFALGNRKARLKIFTPPENDGRSRLVADSASSPSVDVRRLDTFELEPDFIKIDVEGFEAKVLKGAVKTLSRSRPVVLVETNGNVEWESERNRGPNSVASRLGDFDVFTFLRDLDYRAFAPRPTMVEFRNLHEFRCRDFDTVFIPRELAKKLVIRRLTAQEIRIGMAPPL